MTKMLLMWTKAAPGHGLTPGAPPATTTTAVIAGGVMARLGVEAGGIWCKIWYENDTHV